MVKYLPCFTICCCSQARWSLLLTGIWAAPLAQHPAKWTASAGHAGPPSTVLQSRCPPLPLAAAQYRHRPRSCLRRRVAMMPNPLLTRALKPRPPKDLPPTSPPPQVGCRADQRPNLNLRRWSYLHQAQEAKVFTMQMVRKWWLTLRYLDMTNNGLTSNS